MMLQRGTRVGRYQVIEPLGLGGTSYVYKAKNIGDGAPVALKFPAQRLRPEDARQFVLEGRALIPLHHPNIVKVHAVGQQEGWPYLVMEYVDGWALAQEIKARGTFSSDDVYRLLNPVANALDYVHAHGAVHRDVKPGNILFSAKGKPVLVDFGTRSTPWYISPEQAAGKPATARSDQYALAVVTYEMLAGRLPFDGDPRTVIRCHKDAMPPIPTRWVEPLKTLMQTGLQKNPDQRFSSCGQFINGLRWVGQGAWMTSA